MVILLIIASLQAAQATGSIRGVVFGTDNAPVGGARPELSGPDGVHVMQSDGEGQFAFSNLPRAGYRLSVKKEGHIREEYGQKQPGGIGSAIALEDGKAAPSIAFHLQRATTISGEVRNEDGLPVANILVQAMRRSYGLRGNHTITLFSSTLTDDKGNYRLFWLDTGGYYVNA